MKLTKGQELRLLQECSANFLTKKIPCNWYEMSEKEQDSFLFNNTWEHFEGVPLYEVWENIESCYHGMIEFLKTIN